MKKQGEAYHFTFNFWLNPEKYIKFSPIDKIKVPEYLWLKIYIAIRRLIKPGIIAIKKLFHPKLITKYKGKLMATHSGNNPNYKITVDLFLDKSHLLYVLYNVYSHEDVLTKDGLKFLEEYYGLDHIAQMILKEKEGGTDYHFNDKQEVVKWLKEEAARYSN